MAVAGVEFIGKASSPTGARSPENPAVYSQLTNGCDILHVLPRPADFMYPHTGYGNMPAEVTTEDGITREAVRQIVARVVDRARAGAEHVGASAPGARPSPGSLARRPHPQYVPVPDQASAYAEPFKMSLAPPKPGKPLTAREQSDKSGRPRSSLSCSRLGRKK